MKDSDKRQKCWLPAFSPIPTIYSIFSHGKTSQNVVKDSNTSLLPVIILMTVTIVYLLNFRQLNSLSFVK